MNTATFTQLLRQRGEELYRDMPWRTDTRPYYVLVSELMLQQTQVPRVLVKFEEFIRKFPDELALANASLAEVLKVWQGLGYNRRAKFLHEATKQIVQMDAFPASHESLVALPGVGKNTAGAILAYSFNEPSIYIETNVRTVYIHHFFNDQFDVDDKEIIELLELTIDRTNPRQFYQNIMDYGSWLRANGVSNNSNSKHYKKQSALQGSVRQVRGQILRALSTQDLTKVQMMRSAEADDRFDNALSGLLTDGLVQATGNVFHLTK